MEVVVTVVMEAMAEVMEATDTTAVVDQIQDIAGTMTVGTRAMVATKVVGVVTRVDPAIKATPPLTRVVVVAVVDRMAIRSVLVIGPALRATLTTLHLASSACGAA